MKTHICIKKSILSVLLIFYCNNLLSQDLIQVFVELNDITSFSQKVEFLTNQLLIYPKCKELYSNRALYKELLGDERGALKDYNTLIQLDTIDPKSYSLRAELKLYQLNDYTGAISDIDKAISIDPKQQMHYHTRALFKWKMGNFKSAIIDFDRAISLVDNSIGKFTLGRIICGRGECKMAIGDVDGACDDWSSAGEFGYFPAYDLIKKSCH